MIACAVARFVPCSLGGGSVECDCPLFNFHNMQDMLGKLYLALNLKDSLTYGRHLK